MKYATTKLSSTTITTITITIIVTIQRTTTTNKRKPLGKTNGEKIHGGFGRGRRGGRAKPSGYGRFQPRENEVDHTENAKTNFMAQSKGRKFLLEYACRVLKNHPKWDVPKLLDADDHTEIFKPDVRPRPIGKPRPAKKTKSKMTESSGGSASGSILESLSKDLRRKLQAPEYAYKAKKEKEMAYTECKELKFLMIDVDALSEPKASIIRKKQEKIMPKYNQE
ncbi:hypothetical protein Tco_0091459 [Tanacetum coccineum]